jgi:TonB family protein
VPASEQRIVTEKPDEREPLRWPIIVLSALVAGGVIILTAIKAKQYAEKSETTPAASVAASEESAAAPTPAPEPASESPPAAPSPAAAPAPEPPAAAPASDPAAAPELPSKTVAQIEAPAMVDKPPSVADRTPNTADKTPVIDRTPGVDKAPKPRPRPVRVVKQAAAKPRSEPETSGSRAERSDERAASDAGKPEVAKAEPPAPEPPKARAPEPPPSDASTAARPEPPASGPRAGAIDVAATRAAARAQIGPVQQCYERARMDDSSLAGTVQVRITVAPDGSVAKVDVVSSTLGAPPVETCIRQAISRWRLPRPTGGVAASLTYPLVFQ